MPKKHAALGGSGCPRWIPCPGSVLLCADIKPKSSDYADEGTAAHILGEMALNEEKDTSFYLGKKIPVNGKDWEVTEEMMSAVQLYVEAVRLEIKKGCQLFVEQKFDLAKLDPKFRGLEMFGTNDACVSDLFGKLTIFDLKYGQGVAVEVQKNYQLMFYALGAYLALKDSNYVIELVVVQPRKDHVDGPIRRWQLTPDELTDWAYSTLLPAAKETQKPNAPLVPGLWCSKYFCPAQATCPALYQKAMELASNDFVALGNPEKMSPEEIAKMLEFEEILVPFFNEVRKHAKSEMQRGIVIPRHKLIKGRAGNRSWIDEKLVYDLVKSYGDANVYEPRKLKSPAQMDKMVKAEDKRLNRKKRDPNILYGHLITRSEPGVSVASESNPKAALIPSVSSDFKSLESTQKLSSVLL